MPVQIIPFSSAPSRFAQDPSDTQQRPPQVFDYDEFPELCWSICPRREILQSNRTWAQIAVHGQEFFDLPRLPLELRELIYEHCARLKMVDVASWMCESSTIAYPAFLPTICLTSKKTRNEAALVFIRQAAFIIRNKEANEFLDEFLRTLPDDQGFAAVREIKFTSFHWFPGVQVVGRNLDLALMARCSGLKRVLFTFHVEKLMKPMESNDTNGLTHKLRTVQEVIDVYDFGQIINCKDLRSIKFDGILNAGMMRTCDGAPETVLEDLGKWVTEQFAANDRIVQIEPTSWRSRHFFYY